jgi:acetyltransferase-like isoleucine patch superfamily enzyme
MRDGVSIDGPRIHATAIIEEAVEIGAGTRVWDHAHIRGPSRLGSHCILGEKSYVAYGVVIGERVKINAFVYICTGVTIENGVMIGAGTTFTNDRFPRAATPDLEELLSSEPDENTQKTRVRAGATIGANCTIGGDLEIGRFAMVGMGSVVTRSVPDFHLVAGNPARTMGCVCRCGLPVARFESALPSPRDCTCDSCGRVYRIEGSRVAEEPDPERGG